MKVGFYLAYLPWTNYSLINEGLGRYLAKLITVLSEHNCSVTIACPLWIEDAVRELMEENNFSSDQIEFVTPRAESVLWKIIKRLMGRKRRTKKSFREKFLYAGYEISEYVIELLVKLKSSLIFALLVLLAGICAIILLPFALVAAVLYTVVKLICKLFKIDTQQLSFGNPIKRILSLNGDVRDLAKNFISKGMAAETLEKIRRDAADEMISRIGKMTEPADVWYAPMAFWPEFNHIDGVTVTCFPDITSSIFAASFSEYQVNNATDNVRKCVNSGKYFIVYSEYQKRQVLSANLGVDTNHIRSIGISSFVNETLPYIHIKGELSESFENADLQYSASILQQLPYYAQEDVKKFLLTPGNRFSFKDTEYIFYSSQARPNKNLLNLIKAYEYLLRKKEVKFKLFLTCYPDHYIPVRDYIYSNRLQFDIMCFHNVSNQLLAAMYACAKLAVNPTIYEGGFPLTFSEGMSVGTPSVMSKIPQVTDVTEEFGLDKYWFDPFDYKDIAEKILFGINNRELLLKKEMPLYNKLCNDKKNAGKEYIDAFKHFIEMDKAEQKKKKDKSLAS